MKKIRPNLKYRDAWEAYDRRWALAWAGTLVFALAFVFTVAGPRGETSPLPLSALSCCSLSVSPLHALALSALRAYLLDPWPQQPGTRKRMPKLSSSSVESLNSIPISLETNLQARASYKYEHRKSDIWSGMFLGR